MSGRTITVTLPEVLYERVQMTAEASARSVEDVCTQSIALSLPAFEEDLSPTVRAELAALPLLSDAELQGLAHGFMSDVDQEQLAILAEAQKQHPLTTAEATQLAQLLEKAQRLMLQKSEAYRLLARRGHTVFASADASPA